MYYFVNIVVESCLLLNIRKICKPINILDACISQNDSSVALIFQANQFPCIFQQWLVLNLWIIEDGRNEMYVVRP